MSNQLILPPGTVLAKPYESPEFERIERLSPPPGVFIQSPHDKMVTPLDDRGLVDVGALLAEVSGYVDPDYVWRGRLDEHHLFWFENLYNLANLSNQNPDLSRKFRGMPLHKIKLPRELHDFIHNVTLPVEPPEQEVMEYRLESWEIATRLFNSVSVLKKHKGITEADLARKVNKELVRQKLHIIEDCVRRSDNLPKPFWLTTLGPFKSILGVGQTDNITLQHLNRARKRVARFGKVCTHGSVQLHQLELLNA